MSGKPTIRDVARLAGLSIASVSRTLTRPDSVREDTRRRVLAAAEGLGFQMNRQAIDFRRGRSSALVVLVSDIANPFYAEFFKGIEERARAHGYVVLIGDTAGGPASEATYVSMLHSGKADGLISNIGPAPRVLVTPPNPHLYRPVVSCSGDSAQEVPTVRMGNYRAGREVAEHLLALGHTRMAVLHGDLASDDFKARLAGFRDAVTEAGHLIPAHMLAEGDLSIEDGRRLTTALMRAPHPPTAIFTHNDEMALGAMHQLSLMGLSVPDDVSVFGFDDLNYAGAVNPPLTTMRLPRRLWGDTACRKLLDLIEDRPIERDTVIPAELMARGSTAPPPSGGSRR